MSEASIEFGRLQVGPIMPKTSVALSLAATILLHVGAETRTADHQAHGWRVPVSETIHTDYVDHSLPPIGPPSPETIVVRHTTPGTPETKEASKIHFAAAPYARAFDADPAIQEVDHDAANTLYGVVNQLRNEGWENITFKLKGLASAEDATRDGIAGTQSPSDDNTRTGNGRRDALHTYLKADPNLPPDISMELLPAYEGSFTDGQVSVLQGYAKDFEYQPQGDLSAMEVMIDTWELNPGSVPPAVDEALTAWLGGENRGVDVEVFATRQVPGQEITTSEPQRICVIPVQPTDIVYRSTRPWRATLPWFMILPIPALRLRKKDELDSADLDPPYVLMPLPTPAPRPLPVAPSAKSSRRSRREAVATSVGPYAITPETTLASAPEPVLETLPIAPEPTPPTPEPPTAKSPREPIEWRRKWPWLLPIPIILVGGLALRSCGGDTEPKLVPPTEVPADPCANLPIIQRPVGSTEVITLVNGRIIKTNLR